MRRAFSQFLDLAFPEALQYERKHGVWNLTKGVRLVTEPFVSSYASIGILLNVGSRNDGGSPGLAYLTSQLLLSGTKTKSSSVLSSEMRSLGQFSINTTRDSTWLQVLCLKENVPKAFKFLCELIVEPAFSPNVFESVKDQVMMNCEGLMEDPKYLLYENMHNVAFKGHPMGNFIMGDPESLEKVTRAQVAEFVNANYTKKNTVVSAVGGVNGEEMKDLCEKYLWRLPDFEVNNDFRPPAFNSVSILKDVEDDRSFLAFGYPAGSYSHPNLMNFQLLSCILQRSNIASNAESNFYQTATDFDGLYSSSCTLQTYSDCGLLFILLECHYLTLQFVGAGVLRTFNRLATTISDQDLSRGKNLLYSGLVQKTSLTELCQLNANQVRTFGRKISKAEYAGKALSMSKEALVDEMSEWVSSVYPAIAVYGKITDPDVIEKMYQISEK